MQRLPAKASDDLCELFWKLVDLGGIARGIDRVCNQRMADIGDVDTDLVRAPGLELALDPGDVPALVAIARFDGIMSNRLATLLADSLLEPIGGIAPQRHVDSSNAAIGHAPGESGI